VGGKGGEKAQMWARRVTLRLEDTEDLGASDRLDLGDTVGITEHHTDLRGGHALLGHLGDLVNNGGGGGLEPSGGGPPIGLGRSGNTLSVRTNRNEASLSVCRSNKTQHTTHSHIPEAST